MALTESSMIPLKKEAPSFTLVDTVSGNRVALSDVKSDIATVIMFICNHCPYVKHVQEQLVQLALDYQPKGITFIAISSNDANSYPDDHPDRMKEVAQQYGYPFPYLYDETQEVAKAYQAECTPDFYVFDAHLACIYRGQLDDSRPGNGIPVTGDSLRAALDQVLKQEEVTIEQKPSLGCNIKWKK